MGKVKTFEPKSDEYVDMCPYSKTGWAIWQDHDGKNGCTCRPAKQPADVPTNQG